MRLELLPAGSREIGRFGLVWAVVLMIVIGGGAPVPQVRGQARASTTGSASSERHRVFEAVLRRFVDSTGAVDYAGLAAHADSMLTPYLQQLATARPSTLDRDARLAFWINAYNAYTLKLVVDHYPVANVWGITPGPAEPKDNSPFALAVGPVADTVRTLDEIEHEIIRPRFDEPRIHFALVCAASSCPKLRREPYTGARLDAQLDDQARTFLHDPAKNRIPAGEDRIALSRILKWYGGDFGPTTDALQRALAPFFDGPVRHRLADADYAVTYLPYDWTLNDRTPSPSE